MAKKSKKSKKKSALLIIAAVVIIAAACVFAYVNFENNKDSDSESASQSAQSSETVSQSETESSTKTSTTAAAQTTKETTQSSTKEHTTVTTTQPIGYYLPLTVGDAMDALSEHYGNGFKVNSTVEEDGLNYFSVTKGDEKYASVAVDLSTGKATETITATGEKTEFSLVQN